MEPLNPPRLYVLVRANITRTQQAIQAGHGVAKFVKTFPDAWPNRTLLYLRVADETELLNWFNQLKPLSNHLVLYSDPSWDSFTSLAVLGTPEIQTLIKDLSLFKA